MRFIFVMLLAFAWSSNLLGAELVILAKAEGPPKHYLDKDGEPRGYAIEIASEAVRRAGFIPHVQNYPWKRAIKESRQGHGVITAFSKTKKRQKDFLFTDDMYTDKVLLWTVKGRGLKFESFDDLLGKVIGISKGNQYSGEFERMRSRLNLNQDSHDTVRLRMLEAGRIDAAIFTGGIPSVKFLAERARIDVSKFEPAAKPISIDPNHIGIPKKLRGETPVFVLRKLNTAIREMKRDGTIQRILKAYF